MDAYLPLFSISVAHRYFTDGLWKGLSFVASPYAQKIIEASNIIVLPTQSGIGVFYDGGKVDVLKLYANDTNGILPFRFKVYAKNRTFGNYTVPSLHGKKAIFCFDNSAVLSNPESEIIRLSQDDFVSEKDFRDIEALIVEGVLGARERHVPPDFMVDVSLKPSKDGEWSAQDYELKFNTRQSFWKYHLLGNMNKSSPFIVDLDNKVEFEFCGEEMLPGNRPSKVFRSKELIPVLENSDFRFQLREQGQGAGKVLIKRLPVASESGMGFDLVNGKREIVSECFINF